MKRLALILALAAAPAVAQPYHYQLPPSYAPPVYSPPGQPWWLPPSLPPSDPSLRIPAPEAPPPQPPQPWRQP